MGKRKSIEHLIGKTFGDLTIVGEAPCFAYDCRRVFAKCSCNGNIKKYALYSIIDGGSRSCGCSFKKIKKRKCINHLIGQTFNFLTILKDLGNDNKNGKRKILVQCRCGNERKCDLYSVINNIIKSCGCYIKTLKPEQWYLYKHGLSSHPLYKKYTGMKNRCYNPNCARYADWGGRGIKVSDEWLGENGFINFYNDMFPTWKKGLTLDRKNNNLDYSKENCQWSTPSEQARNTRRNRLLTLNGETKCLIKWAEQYQIDANIIMCRLRRGWSVDRAITTPKK